MVELSLFTSKGLEYLLLDFFLMLMTLNIHKNKKPICNGYILGKSCQNQLSLLSRAERM